MSRLIRLALLLIVACTALIFAAQMIGSVRPNPLSGLFTNADGTPCERPCLLGVRPGETTMGKAVALIRQHPLVRSTGALEAVRAPTSGLILHNAALVVSLDKDDRDRVGRIRLYGPNGLPSGDTPAHRIIMGDTLAWLGTPSTTRIITANQPPIKYSVQLFYEQQQLYVVGRITTGSSLLRLDTGGLLEAIGLYEDAWFSGPFAYEQSKADVWQGFTDSHHYSIQIP